MIIHLSLVGGQYLVTFDLSSSWMPPNFISEVIIKEAADHYLLTMMYNVYEIMQIPAIYD